MHRSHSPPVESPQGISRRPLNTAVAPQEASGPADGKRMVVRSADLLGTLTAIEIEHKGQLYRLQATRSGKLILTK